MTARESQRLARRFWRARVAGRRVWVEAKRCGCSTSTMRRHAYLWPEELEKVKASCTLRPWERAIARTLRAGRTVYDD